MCWIKLVLKQMSKRAQHKAGTQQPSAHWEPVNWNKVWHNIKQMRADRTAAVDTMGCERLADINAPPKDQRYQHLLALMLSSQTNDQTTSAAMTRLKQHGCSIDSVLNTSDKILGELIYPVGFWKKKVVYIKKTTQILKDKFDGDVPNTIKDLCSLPGVGPKMAHLVMATAWHEVTGIAVDTHVHRIVNRIGWTCKPTSTPINTQTEIERWIPRDMWREVNLMLVGFGQQICLATSPKCADCLNKDLCPFGKRRLRSVQSKARKRPNISYEEDDGL